jgi:hypothetical protein
MIIGSYHKTGTRLFYFIWLTYFNKYNIFFFDHIDKLSDEIINNNKYIVTIDHFDRTSNEMIKNTKCIVIIRHPLEIIMSGVRYHQITNEKWCKEDKYNGLSYQKHIQKLNDDDKIIFEMENCGKKTINAIYNDMKNRNFNNNILFIKLEDLYDKKNIPIICKKIKNHFNSTLNIDCEELNKSFLINLNKSFHRTNKNNTYTYNKYFKEHHINHFNKLFPIDTLEIMGYANK